MWWRAARAGPIRRLSRRAGFRSRANLVGPCGRRARPISAPGGDLTEARYGERLGLASIVVRQRANPERTRGYRICGGAASSAVVFFDIRLMRRIGAKAIEGLFSRHAVLLPQATPKRRTSSTRGLAVNGALNLQALLTVSHASALAVAADVASSVAHPTSIACATTSSMGIR